MRIVTITGIAVLLVLCGARAAGAKPKVAILGVEVAGTIDQTSTGVAHDLTEGMRSKAKQGGGPYQLAPNSDRELIDEKVLKNCDSEGPLCMSDIGKDVGTDVLIYGKLEKTADGYKARLHVLDVRTKTHEKAMDILITTGSSSDTVRNQAKKAYVDLVGGAGGATGTLTIKANVDDGNVLVDEEQKDPLSSGKVTLVLLEGRYKVAIESPGHRRKEKTVMISAGDAVTESFELETLGGGGGKLNVWKPIFGVSLALGLVIGGYALYEYGEAQSEQELIKAKRASNVDIPLGSGDCGTSDIVPNSDQGGHFDSACKHYKREFYAAITAGVFGGVAAVSFYMAFFRSSKSEATQTSSRRGRVRDFAVTPVITPDTQGALVRFAW